MIPTGRISIRAMLPAMMVAAVVASPSPEVDPDETATYAIAAARDEAYRDRARMRAHLNQHAVPVG